MRDAVLDVSSPNKYATAPKLPIWLNFRVQNKGFSQSLGQYLIGLGGEHVTNFIG